MCVYSMKIDLWKKYEPILKLKPMKGKKAAGQKNSFMETGDKNIW